MKPLLLTASIAMMLLSSAAFAAPERGGHGDHPGQGTPAWTHDRDHDGDHERGHDGDRDRGHGWDHDRGRDADRDHDRDRDHASWHDNHDGRGWDRRYYSDHDNGRHRGFYRQSFRHGERLPVVYMQPRYYVNDWRDYRLAPPPRGYMWVRPPDGRFLLVAATTGLIAEILGY